jgi:hypothetical protein
MRVNCDGREPFGSGNVGEVLAEALLVDRQVIGEWQQDGGDHSVRGVMGMAGHLSFPHERRFTIDL